MPTYFLIAFKLHKWMIKGIDRFRRGFFGRVTTISMQNVGIVLLTGQHVLDQEFVVVLASKTLKNLVELLDCVGFGTTETRRTGNGNTS
jgi:hypothetical protein